jgi:hypothetical protein
MENAEKTGSMPKNVVYIAKHVRAMLTTPMDG